MANLLEQKLEWLACHQNDLEIPTEISNLIIQKLQMSSNLNSQDPEVPVEASNLLNNELYQLLQKITKKSDLIDQKLDLFSVKPSGEPTQLVNLINQKVNILLSSGNNKDQKLDVPTLFNLIG